MLKVTVYLSRTLPDRSPGVPPAGGVGAREHTGRAAWPAAGRDWLVAIAVSLVPRSGWGLAAAVRAASP